MQAVTAVTLREKLLSVGVDALLVDELVTVATRVNYGQMMMMMMMIIMIMMIIMMIIMIATPPADQTRQRL